MANLNLTDHFLIAMPAIADSYFSKSLIYIAEHNAEGALGLIVNRPVNINLASFFTKIDIPFVADEFPSQPVFFGGPVQPDRGFVLHRPIGEWQSTLSVNESIGLTTSRDVLVSIAKQGTPRDAIVALGYSGWGAGQLENEMVQNAWLSVAADHHILFNTPYEERLSGAMKLLGIDPMNFSGQAGHA